ncbi:MAG: galactose oxidase early set domain-containing protein [Aquabacterium sp.]|nr:galactose oxidase early set domain-containing protein [Aquabacterium sp.]
MAPDHYAPIPELYNPKTGWRTLPGAESDQAFGERNWDYPRVWQAPNGKLFALSVDGSAYSVDASGEGSIEKLNVDLPRGHPYLPSVMYMPGKIMAVRWLGETFDIDINGKQPDIKTAAWSGLVRFNSSLTIMADGKLLLNGGGLLNNGRFWYLTTNYESKIWDPATEKWSVGAIAKRMRMYHSSAVLLTDGTVLTGGGGGDSTIPGRNENLNAEIYYPPYLFKNDESGEFATRPVLQAAPTYVAWGQSFEIRMDTSDVSKMNFIKTGSATHTNNFDQRLVPLVYKALGGGRFEVVAPASGNVAPPGYYHLFVLNQAGVPAVSRLVKLGS